MLQARAAASFSLAIPISSQVQSGRRNEADNGRFVRQDEVQEADKEARLRRGFTKVTCFHARHV